MTDWLTPPSSPTTPPHQLLLVTPRRKVIPINPRGYVSPAMALNNEPADPAVRESQHLAPKSYADAAEEALAHDDGNDVFDEATIKETPPPTSRMAHNHSEPRPLGEMIDEDEMALPPNSPTLRHVVGRLEKPGSNGSGSRPDSIKGVSPSRSSSKSVKGHSPNPSHGSPIAIKTASPTPPRIDNFLAKGHNDHDLSKGVDTPAVEKANGLSYAGAVKEAEPTAPHVAEQNGTRSEDVAREVEAPAPSDTNAQNGLSYAGAVKDVEPTAPHVDEQNGHRLDDVPEEANSSDTVDAPSQNGHSEVDADASKKGETAPESKEQNGHTEADATKEPRPSTPANKDTQDDHSYADAVKDVEPTSPHVDEQNGNATSNGVAEEAPTSYSGVGRDDTPRSPTPKKAHKRVSSKSLKSAAKKQAEQQSSEGVMSYQREWQQGVQSSASPETAAGLGVVFEEKYRSKSGLNLTTVDADSALEKASLSSRANKDITTEPQATPRHERKSSELVSGRRAGAGWATSAIRWAPANVPLQRRLQTLMVLVHTLSIAGGLALFFLLCAIPLLWPILLPYLVYVLLSHAPTSGELSHRSEWARNSRIWSLFASYYPARLHRTVPLEPTRKYIFGYHPHGIISHGAFAAFATEALGFKQLFPGITNTLLTLDANFRVPLYRDYALRMGLASVSRESCENILSKGGRNGEGMGRAITIVVGGARESLDAKPGSLKLVLKKRKGFVKLAIRQGADLVPTLAFGENDLYEQFDSNGHPYVHRAQLMVKKLLGFTVPLFHARGMLCSCPRPTPLTLLRVSRC
jgi:2-acylglycerol O-acyltransferase 2